MRRFIVFGISLALALLWGCTGADGDAPASQEDSAAVGFGGSPLPDSKGGGDTHGDSAVEAPSKDIAVTQPDLGEAPQKDAGPTTSQDVLITEEDVAVFDPPEGPLQCMEAAGCVFGCPSGTPECDAACKENLSDEEQSLMDSLVDCKRNQCPGMDLLSSMGCAANHCACNIAECGECSFDCTASGEDSCLETFHCLTFDCDIKSNISLAEAMDSACCLGDCFAQASPEARIKVTECITCAATKCPNKSVMSCAVAECSEICMGCTAQ